MARDASFFLAAGSDVPLVVQLYNGDSETAYDPIDLTGSGSVSASARLLDDSAASISFDSASISNAPNGEITLGLLTTTFTQTGTYYVQIQFTDGGGKVHIYPASPDGKALRLTVVPAL